VRARRGRWLLARLCGDRMVVTAGKGAWLPGRTRCHLVAVRVKLLARLRTFRWFVRPRFHPGVPRGYEQNGGAGGLSISISGSSSGSGSGSGSVGTFKRILVAVGNRASVGVLTSMTIPGWIAS
jgi:hypothetical protein